MSWTDERASALLDTIAQLPTAHLGEVDVRYPDDSQTDQMVRRATYKHLTNAYTWALSELDSPLKKSYFGALLCTHYVRTEGPNIHSQFCGQRWCLTCAKRRAAKSIVGYDAQFARLREEAGGLHFVTLTIPNVPGPELPKALRDLSSSCTNSVRVLREKRHLRISGVRKMECTHNNMRKDFHPHLHLIVGGTAEQAEELVKEHLRRWPGAVRAAQDVRPATPESTVELFKYFTKIVSKTDRGKPSINIPALDTIFRACRGTRVFQPFGSVKKSKESPRHYAEVVPTPLEVMLRRTYEWETDWRKPPGWYDPDTREPLLPAWQPSRGVSALVASAKAYAQRRYLESLQHTLPLTSPPSTQDANT